MSEKELPTIKFKDYPYEIALWRKTNEHGVFYDGKITYSYKDKAGTYQDHSLPIDGNQLARLGTLIDAATLRRLAMLDADRAAKRDGEG